MAGPLSSHLIDAHHPDSPFNSSIVSHGAMSFNPMMHGTPHAQRLFSMFNSQPSFAFANDSISEETARKIATLQVKLDQKLGPEYISQRPGPGGGPKLTYVEGWKIINLANEVFGFNGWSSSIVSLTTDFADYSEETRRYSVGVTAIMRVTLKDGVFHEDTGYGMLENSKSKGAALDKCKKEAVTDGLKRALRNFGNVLGNCLYDKSYTSEIIKVKFEPVKFNKDELHRRPEFDDVKPNIASTSSSTSSAIAGPSNHNMTRLYTNQVATPTRPSMQQNQAKPLTSLPPHMRPGLQTTSNASSMSTSNITTPTDAKGKGPAHPNQRPTGLNTPITTPIQPLAQQPNVQQQQQNNRRVSFQDSTPAPPLPPAAPAPMSKLPAQAAAAAPKVKPELDDEDSFGFGSEDDALFAMADLGPPIGANDADLGRPIESDIETGRPIDQEEGLLQSLTDDADESAVFTVHPAARAGAADADATTSKSTPPSRSDPKAAQSRRELIAAALQGEESGNAAAAATALRPTTSGGLGLATGMLSKLLPQQQQQARGGPTSFASMMLPPPPPQANQHSRTNTISQQNHQRYVNQKQNQNQNQNPAQPTSTTARASTPSSMGGFNFPPGVNPVQPGAVPSISNATTIGVKRPFEATTTSNSNSNFRSARPGMGLQHATSGVGGANMNMNMNNGNNNNFNNNTVNGKREVLGALDIEEGGNVKRVRR